MARSKEVRRKVEFLERLYEELDESEYPSVDPVPIGVRMGIEYESEVHVLVDDLVRSGLVENTYDDEVSITEAGIREVKRDLSAAAKPPEPLPANFVVKVAGDLYGLQAGTLQSTQNVTVNFAAEMRAIEAFLAEFRSKLDQLPLNMEQLEDVTEDLEVAEAQLQRPRPRPAVLQAAVYSLREVALGAAGSGAFTGLAELAQHIHI